MAGVSAEAITNAPAPAARTAPSRFGTAQIFPYCRGHDGRDAGGQARYKQIDDGDVGDLMSSIRR
jgi:hypothetical protein